MIRIRMIKENIDDVKKRIISSCVRANRKRAEISLMAVTKIVEPEKIHEAISCGIRIIGESRIEEAMDKFPFLGLEGIEKHFIGTIQSNKIKKICEVFDVIQSVEKIKHAKLIDIEAKRLGKIIPVFIEVNIGDEESKHGVSPDSLKRLIEKASSFTSIRIRGIMTVAPYLPKEETRPFFRRMKALAEETGMKEISMGMSNDFEIAIEEGATLIRIGTAIFGNRRKKMA